MKTGIKKNEVFLLFHIGSHRCVIDTSIVIEIIPQITLSKIPNSPDYIAGIFDLHGKIVPVLDLCQIALSRSCQKSFSTRIILINYSYMLPQKHVLGLMAERVTDTLNLSMESFCDTGVTIEEAPYFGSVARDEAGIVQLIHIDKLIPQHIHKILFKSEE